MLISILVPLVLAALLLWLITQLPLDPTIVKIIRAVVIVAVVLWLLGDFFGFSTGDWGVSHRWRR